MTMESRIDSLLNAVLYKREKNRSTINGAEQDIIRNAENFRLMNAWSDGKAEKIVRSASGWMQQQELMRFLSSVTDKDRWSSALSLAEWASASDLSFRSGVLTNIMIEADNQGVPPEWIAAEKLNDKEPPAKPEPHTEFHINEDALL